jgi:tetratricopeptide (TPR) repeat protein
MTAKKKALPASGLNSSSGVGGKGAATHSSDPSTLSASEQQLHVFEQALKQFRAQQFHDAYQLFEQAVKGPVIEVSHNAKTHMTVCSRRMKPPEPRLETLEDHYNYAVERLNARDLASAQRHLAIAMDLSNQEAEEPADYLYYALALHASLSGDVQGTYENLKRAIELDPKNRFAARQDADFAQMAQQSPLQPLLFPEKGSAY